MAPKSFFLLCMTHQRRQGNRFSSFPLSLLHILPSSQTYCSHIAFICSSHRQFPPVRTSLPRLYINTFVSPPIFLLSILFIASSPYILPTVFVSQLAYCTVVAPLAISQPWYIGGFPERETNWLFVIYTHLNWSFVHKHEQISYRCILFILVPLFLELAHMCTHTEALTYIKTLP